MTVVYCWYNLLHTNNYTNNSFSYPPWNSLALAYTSGIIVKANRYMSCLSGYCFMDKLGQLISSSPSPSSSFLACNSRLRRAICWAHPPQRPVLGHIHCFRQCEIMGSQILLYGAQPCDAGASSWSPPVFWRESWQDPLGICVIIHTRNFKILLTYLLTRNVIGLLQWVWIVLDWELCTSYSSSCRHHFHRP